jgi:hypothetical protein
MDTKMVEKVQLRLSADHFILLAGEILNQKANNESLVQQ